MFSQKSKWLLPLPDFKPTNINYSVSDDKACPVCRDYSEIDNFAKGVTLQKLQPLCNNTNKTGSTDDTKHDPKFFNATILLQSLSLMKGPVTNGGNPQKNEDGRKVLQWLKDNGSYNADTDQTLRVLFSRYANYPYKSEEQLRVANQPIKDLMNKLQYEIDELGDEDPRSIKMKAQIQELQEKLELTMLVWRWFQDEGRPGQVSNVAMALWMQFVKAKSTVHGYIHDNGPNADHVAKARLIYTWLGLSIDYDDDLANDPAQLDRLKSDRPVADTLATGKEVCRGYAEMFVEMFRAMCLCEGSDKTSETDKVAHVINGRARPEGGSSSHNLFSTEPAHAWCAFPVPSSPDDMKIIDPTWGRRAGASGAVVDSLWFCMTNESMALSHCPYKEKNFYASGPSNQKPEDFWKMEHPIFPREGRAELIWINLWTICPFGTANLTLAGKQETISVQFHNNCKHQGAKQKGGSGFWLGFQPEKQKNENDFLGKKFSPTTSVKFETTQNGSGSNSGPWLWKAAVKLTQSESGWLGVYSVGGGLAGLGQTYRRVVLWWVQGPLFSYKL